MEIDENEVLRPATHRGDHENEGGSSSAGTTELPISRIKTIMQKGSDDLPISQEGLFAMTKAAEMFIAELVRNLYEATDSNYIEYSHLADYVQDNDELDFLHDMIPRMINFKEATLLAKNADNVSSGN